MKVKCDHRSKFSSLSNWKKITAMIILHFKLCEAAGDIRSFSHNFKIDLSPMVWEQN